MTHLEMRLEIDPDAAEVIEGEARSHVECLPDGSLIEHVYDCRSDGREIPLRPRQFANAETYRQYVAGAIGLMEELEQEHGANDVNDECERLGGPGRNAG